MLESGFSAFNCSRGDKEVEHSNKCTYMCVSVHLYIFKFIDCILGQIMVLVYVVFIIK